MKKLNTEGGNNYRTNLFDEDLDFINAVRKIKTNEDVTDEKFKTFV